MSRSPDTKVEPLLLDRAAAAEQPSDDAIREWARDKRGFVSSVMDELPTERQGAAAGIRALGGTAVLFEEFGGRDADPSNAYLSEVRSCDVYVGVLGRRYGRPLPSGFSATHAEYREAQAMGLRIAAWASATDDREGHQRSFLDEVRVFHVVPEFRTPADLQRQVEARLRVIAAEDLAPWCKLGSIVFRGTEIADRGSEIAVTGRVRSDEVAHAIERLRGHQGMPGDAMWFTWAGRSRYVRVASVETTTTAARSRVLRLALRVVDPPRDSLSDMGFQGLTAEQLTEAGLREVLFGTRHPLDGQRLTSLGRFPDPLAALRQADVADEAIRPLAELVLTDALIGSGRARRITGFALGSRVAGRRTLRLSWQAPPRYSSEPPATFSIEGTVTL